MTFDQMGLIAPITKAIQEEGYTTPTPIQAQSIPHLLQQKDLLGCAQTGTGKTAAFALPILQLLHQAEVNKAAKRSIRTLILTPTRELAIQIQESLQSYGRHLPLKHLVIFGGVGQQPQVNALKQGVDVVVATPGRLLDLMNQGYVKLHEIEIFVLDEADRMLDMGFLNDVKKVIAKLPSKRQTLFFSATMPPDIQKLANNILVNPVKVEVTPVSSTAEKVEQLLFPVEKNEKRHLLLHLLQQNEAMTSVLVFTRTKHGADRVVKDLLRHGQTAQAIHGNKSQNARQNALQNFKDATTRVLVATDIAARGIDIDDLGFVINYDIPNIPETYVHRIGRTGRAGASGIALSFCEKEEVPYLKDIQKLIGLTIPVKDDHPFRHTRSAPDPDERAPRQPRQQQQPRRNNTNTNGNSSNNNNRPPAPRSENRPAAAPRPAQTHTPNQAQPPRPRPVHPAKAHKSEDNFNNMDESQNHAPTPNTGRRYNRYRNNTQEAPQPPQPKRVFSDEERW